jgi:hypothetical protein
MNKFLISAVAACTALAAACGGEAGTNSNTANSNANRNTMQAVDANNLPPGLSASPIVPTGNSTPGIPAPGNANVAKGTTPTPGIPDPKTLGKPLKPGATPTPGIPDPETIRRQMQQTTNGANRNPVPPPTSNTGEPSRRKVNRPANSQ